jgi:hypothetical protein
LKEFNKGSTYHFRLEQYETHNYRLQVNLKPVYRYRNSYKH